MNPGKLTWLALAAACSAGGADVERQGDAHYREGRFEESVTAYRGALESAGRTEIWAKLGAAALAAGQAAVAVDAYEQLGKADPSRAAEAARGLERALRALAREDDSLGTAARAAALRRVSPDRPLGRIAAAAAASDPGATGPELLLAAVAGALAGADVDRLLLRTAGAPQAGGSCESSRQDG